MSRFGRFELQRAPHRLLRDGVPLPLRERAMEVLLALLEQPGRVVSKQLLCARAWPGQGDAENNLQVEVSALRKLLGAAAIVTVPGRGYQFALPLAACGVEPIGRESDRARLLALLQPGSLVMLTGEAGAGKTLLAEAVLQGWAGPAVRLDLPAAGDGSAIRRALARALHVPADDGAAAEAALHAPGTLLLLDACDGVLPAVAELAGRLAERCPALALLATSREVLRLSAERVWRLGGLSLQAAHGAEPDAVRLLRREGPADAAPAGALEVCRRLDGHPLAIMLAARQGRTVGVAALLQRLDERLDWPGPPRSLRARLDDSVARLGADERALFVGLAGLPNPFRLEDLPADAHDAWERIELLGRLVDKSLVRIEAGDPGGPPRYGLSSTVRLYALELAARRAPQP
jgi:DNA-binding winged helix-turn-helix (wHTH) protein/predicted ATPase